jgi:hypothetical protein
LVDLRAVRRLALCAEALRDLVDFFALLRDFVDLRAARLPPDFDPERIRPRLVFVAFFVAISVAPWESILGHRVACGYFTSAPENGEAT